MENSQYTDDSDQYSVSDIDAIVSEDIAGAPVVSAPTASRTFQVVVSSKDLLAALGMHEHAKKARTRGDVKVKRKGKDVPKTTEDASNIKKPTSDADDSKDASKHKYVKSDKSDESDDSDESDLLDYDEEEMEYLERIGPERARELEELEDRLYEIEDTDVPMRFRILQSPLPERLKARVLKKYLDVSVSASSDAAKWLAWVEGMMKIPFGIYRAPPVDVSDAAQVAAYLVDAQRVLDRSVHGHAECKDMLVQLIAQFIAKSDGRGTAFGIQGPPGNGKTSLVRDGVSRVLGRPFYMIALGGMTDGAYFEGHSITYEGSTWGRLVQILMDAQCMNPIIFFDELDKVSETRDGDEIVGILTHLIDFTQNDKIHDKYFSGVDLDFSKCIFIFSFNDETKLNPVLRDRMRVIRTDALPRADKLVIARDYVLRNVLENVNLQHHDVIFPDSVLEYVHDTYTFGEEGVREFKRRIETVVLRLNVLRLTETEKYALPYTVTRAFVDSVLKTDTHRKCLAHTHKNNGMYL